MTHQAPDALLAVRRLDRWARSTDVGAAKEVAKRLAAIHSAAHHVLEAIESLGGESGGPRQDARALLDVQTWLYQELLPNAALLENPLEAMIKALYDREPATEE
jgi:hypothetical protein